MSLTPVMAMVSIPFAFSAATFATTLGRCCLLQTPVNAPGTANRATFLPLKISSVVFHAGPSPAMTRNFVLGRLSPTLIAMMLILSLLRFYVTIVSPTRRKVHRPARRVQISVPGELVETVVTSIAAVGVTAVSVMMRLS